MNNFDEKTATADELWDWCMLEYRSRNPITKALLDHFFGKIALILNGLEQD